MEESSSQLDTRVRQAPLGLIILLPQGNLFKIGKLVDHLMENGVVCDIFSLVDDSQRSDVGKL